MDAIYRGARGRCMLKNIANDQLSSALQRVSLRFVPQLLYPQDATERNFGKLCGRRVNTAPTSSIPIIMPCNGMIDHDAQN